MTEREKVKAGLECLTHVNFAVYKTDCDTDEDNALLGSIGRPIVISGD